MSARAPQGLSSRYDVLREIGRGGTSIVYLAIDRESGRQVAIKVLREELAASVSVARFLREIRYLRSLRHVNILPILDASEGGDALYFVTPYAEGHTLRERLNREGPLPLHHVLQIVAHLADGIDFAHAQNIVHRDLKPENILFEGDRAMLCDFGIARAIIVSSNEEALSSSGIMIGTPNYMSPEQSFLDAPIDGRCDTYALGCVTYEMLTGEVPFPAAGLLAKVAAHASTPPRSIVTVRPDVPAAVEAAVFRAMSKAAADRPPTAHAFLDLLQRGSTGEGAQSEVRSRTRTTGRGSDGDAQARLGGTL